MHYLKLTASLATLKAQAVSNRENTALRGCLTAHQRSQPRQRPPGAARRHRRQHGTWSLACPNRSGSARRDNRPAWANAATVHHDVARRADFVRGPSGSGGHGPGAGRQWTTMQPGGDARWHRTRRAAKQNTTWSSPKFVPLHPSRRKNGEWQRRLWWMLEDDRDPSAGRDLANQAGNQIKSIIGRVLEQRKDTVRWEVWRPGQSAPIGCRNSEDNRPVCRCRVHKRAKGVTELPARDTCTKRVPLLPGNLVPV
jgi:hypothetical protein